MSFFENTRKPVGFGGKIMVAMMNFGHSAMAEWGLRFLQSAPDAMVLDCGCGGGANIKTLLKLCLRIRHIVYLLKKAAENHRHCKNRQCFKRRICD